MSNNKRFERRKNIVKITWTILFTISVFATILIVCLAINDKELVYDTYYTKPGYTSSLYFLTIWDIFCIVFWICSIIGVKFKIYSYNEHDISIYLGWGCAYLLLDDVIVDKHNGSFVGASPLECDFNGERIYLKVGALTLNNYTLRVGNKILH